MAKYSTLAGLFTAIANALRPKVGSGDRMLAEDFPSLIQEIPTVADGSLPTQAGKVVAPSETAQVAVNSGKYTTGDVSVGAIPSNYVGSAVGRRSGNRITPTNQAQMAIQAGEYANGDIVVDAIPDHYKQCWYATITTAGIQTYQATSSTSNRNLAYISVSDLRFVPRVFVATSTTQPLRRAVYTVDVPEYVTIVDGTNYWAVPRNQFDFTQSLVKIPVAVVGETMSVLIMGY